MKLIKNHFKNNKMRKKHVLIIGLFIALLSVGAAVYFNRSTRDAALDSNTGNNTQDMAPDYATSQNERLQEYTKQLPDIENKTPDEKKEIYANAALIAAELKDPIAAEYAKKALEITPSEEKVQELEVAPPEVQAELKVINEALKLISEGKFDEGLKALTPATDNPTP